MFKNISQILFSSGLLSISLMIGSSVVQAAPGEQFASKSQVQFMADAGEALKAAYQEALAALRAVPEGEDREPFINNLLDPLREMMRFLYVRYEADQREAGEDEDKLLRAKIEFFRELMKIVYNLYDSNLIHHVGVLGAIAEVAQAIVKVGMDDPLGRFVEILRAQNPGHNIQVAENELLFNTSSINSWTFVAAILHLYGIHFYPDNQELEPSPDDVFFPGFFNYDGLYFLLQNPDYGLGNFRVNFITYMMRQGNPLDAVYRLLNRGFVFDPSTLTWATELRRTEIVDYLREQATLANAVAEAPEPALPEESVIENVITQASEPVIQGLTLQDTQVFNFQPRNVEAELTAYLNHPGVQRVFTAIIFLYLASYFYGSFSY